MENARLWSELENRYASAMETLKKTQARLIDMERTAAYVRLAQAMAHEIRNPLMVIGGLVRGKLARIDVSLNPLSLSYRASRGVLGSF